MKKYELALVVSAKVEEHLVDRSPVLMIRVKSSSHMRSRK